MPLPFFYPRTSVYSTPMCSMLDSLTLGYEMRKTSYLMSQASMSSGYGYQWSIPMPDINQFMATWNTNPNNSMNPWNNNTFNNSWSTNPWQNSWQNPWGQNPSSSSNTNGAGEGDGAEKREYEDITALITEIKKYPELTNAEKNAISKAEDEANKAEKTSEKIKILKAAINTISENTMKEILSSEENNNFEGIFYDELIKAGYEYKNTEIDKQIKDFHEALNDLSESNDYTGFSDIDGLLDYDAETEHPDHVLDIISSWNSKYGTSNKADKRIISLICNMYSEAKEKNANDETLKGIKGTVNTYIDALINKAEQVEKLLDGTDKAKVAGAIQRLDSARNNNDNFDTDDGKKLLSDNFDTLYLMLRQATIDITTSNIKQKYDFINTINDDTFQQDTIKDLINEGFSAEEIENCAVKSATKTKNSQNPTPDDDMAELTQGGFVSKSPLKYTTAGKEYDVYEETEITGNRDYKRLFIVKGNDIQELKNAKIEGGAIVKIDQTTEIEENPIAKNTIKKDVNKTLEDKQAQEEERIALEQKRQAEAIRAQQDAEERNDAYEHGIDTGILLRSWTNTDDTTNINAYLTDITKDNVYEFLKGYYVGDDKLGKTEGLIEHLDDDNAGGNITMASKINLVNCILEKAKALGLAENQNYKDLEKIMGKYSGKNPKPSCKERTEFNDKYEKKGYWKIQNGKRNGAIASWTAGAAAGAGIGAWIGGIGAVPGAIIGALAGAAGTFTGLGVDQITDNEKMDEAIEALYLEMKKKIESQATTTAEQTGSSIDTQV